MENIQSIRAKINQTADRKGSNSQCFLTENHALLYGPINPEHISKRKKIIDSYISKGISIAAILEYELDKAYISSVSDWKKGWTLQQRAKGRELRGGDNLNSYYTIKHITDQDNLNEKVSEYNESLKTRIVDIEMFANCPQEHITKFIEDLVTIEKDGLLVVDPSKPSNFFYDKGKGFTFIDLGLRMSQRQITPEQLDYYIASVTSRLLTPFLPIIDLCEKAKQQNGASERIKVIPSQKKEYIANLYKEILKKTNSGLLANNIEQSENTENEWLSDIDNAYSCANSQEVEQLLSAKISNIIQLNCKYERNKK